jgi:hypothetical protein
MVGSFNVDVACCEIRGDCRNIMVEWIAFLFRISETLSSNIDEGSGYVDCEIYVVFIISFRKLP